MSNNPNGNNRNKKSTKKKRNKKMNTKKKVFITLGIILLFLVGFGLSAVGYGYSLLDKMDKVELDDKNLDINENLSQYKGIQNIALFGVDSTDGSSGRSDAIMILTIDNDKKELRLSSILRDSYVNIAGHGKDKINHAYAFGGPELAIKTLNSNYDLNITDFASVDFASLPKIIDALGGIELDITQEEIDSQYLQLHFDEINKINGTNSKPFTKPGLQHVDGTQALVYARIRYTSAGDEGRTERHQIVFNKLLEKFKNTSPTQYPKLLNQFMPLVKTSLSSSEILGLATDVVNMGGVNLESTSFPKDTDSKGIMVNGVYYLDFNKDVTVSKMHDFIFNAIK